LRTIALLLVITITLAGCGNEKGIPAQGEQPAESTALIQTEQVPEARNITAGVCDDPVKTEAATAIAEGVLSRFPPGLQEIAGIDSIYICEGLTSLDMPVPAASIHINEKTSVYVDASAPRRIDVSLTHELFHAIEFKKPLDEEVWAQIYPYESYPFDTASPGEIIRYVPNMIPAFEPGFVSDYARFSGMEDRAELFSVLYSGRGLSAKERTALLSDPFLMEKITFLKDYLDTVGLTAADMKDNLFSEKTSCFCKAYTLTNPELARTGPSEAYPGAGLRAGQLLADSGFDKDGIKMLYNTSDRTRVYAPAAALELIEDETVKIEL